MGNRVVSIRDVRVYLPLAAVLVLALAAAPRTAAAATYYAKPTGTGISCSQAVPCSIGEVVSKAGPKDTAVLAAGEYDLPFAGITIDDQVDFGAAVPGKPAILKTTDVADIHITTKADPTLHDLRIEGEGGLRLGSGSATRVFVSYFGVLTDACELEKGTTLKDSVCWTLEVGEEEEGVSHAIEISSGGEKQDETVYLRNVTAIADNAEGDAIHAIGSAGANLTVDAANVIARSVNGADVATEITEGGFSKSHVNIVNSNFATVVEEAPEAAVTPVSTNGNIAAAPTFVSPGQGDFHVDGTSPTLDAGIADILTGSLDLEGNDRAQAKCFGAAPVPDMGAYERSPTAVCAPPPPLPPPPVEPRRPVFRVLSLNLNRKTGAGRLLVEVPGSGTLSLTGSGVKLVRRTASGDGGVISLPIQTWAITKVRLAKLGKTKVRLKVIFESRAGGVEQWSKAVLLRKKTS